jgi:hypothetical protein
VLTKGDIVIVIDEDIYDFLLGELVEFLDNDHSEQYPILVKWNGEGYWVQGVALATELNKALI